MIVRTATEADLNGIFEIDVSLALNRNATQRVTAAVARGDVLVADDDGAVVGLVDFNHLFFGHTFVALLEVHPDHRRRGIATRLLEEVASRARTDRLFTSTMESNPVMHDLLPKRGYVRTGVVENIDPGDREIFYVKFL
jgi:GNAT superfamily N-acetyltransferase